MTRPACTFPALALGLALAPAPAGAVDYLVRIAGFSYEPAELVVTDEDRVTIEAGGGHPLRGDDGSFVCDSNCEVDLPPGIHGYHCANHGAPGSGMAGRITVIEATLFVDGFEDP